MGKEAGDRIDGKVSQMQQSPPRRLLKRLLKAAIEFANPVSELQQNIENSEYLRELRYWRENRSRKAYNLVDTDRAL